MNIADLTLVSMILAWYVCWGRDLDEAKIREKVKQTLLIECYRSDIIIEKCNKLLKEQK